MSERLLTEDEAAELLAVPVSWVVSRRGRDDAVRAAWPVREVRACRRGGVARGVQATRAGDPVAEAPGRGLTHLAPRQEYPVVDWPCTSVSA